MLFQTSTLTFGNAKTLVARSSASAGDADAENRAGEALQAATQHWSNYDIWVWSKVIYPNIAVSAAASTYSLPPDVKAIYDVRLVTNKRPLFYMNRRLYDRIVFDQTSGDVPIAYDLFRQGGEGKIELFPPVGISDNMSIKYYRRLTIPCNITSLSATATSALTNVTVTSTAGITVGSPLVSATAFPTSAGVIVSAVTSATTLTASVASAASVSETLTIGGNDKLLDIPQDYEWYLLAWATHFYLANHGSDSRPERLKYWADYSQMGLVTAKAGNVRTPDEDLAFMPPAMPPFPDFDLLSTYRGA